MDITGYLVLSLVVWFVPIYLVTRFAMAKGLSGFGFAVAAVAFWPLALLIAAIVPNQARSR